MLPKSMSPAQAAPAPHSHKVAAAVARQEIVEDRINIMRLPFRAMERDRPRSPTDLGEISFECNEL
jgi:hypothetical protein